MLGNYKYRNKISKNLNAIFISTLNDGACAVLLATEEKAKELGVKPMAKIVSYGDAATNPVDFPIAPALVIPKLLKAAKLKLDDIALFELNEAFSVVPLAGNDLMVMSKR